jgi:hypothetical protein
LRPKTSRLLFGHLVWGIFIFFFWISELHISQAFQEYQACQIPTLYELVVKFCSKGVLNSFFMYFLRSSYIQSCGWNCPKTEGHGAKKEVCFAHRILVFHFFFTFFFCSWFYMMSFIMWLLQSECEVFDFFKKICKVHNIEVLS